MWCLIVSVRDHCLSFYFSPFSRLISYFGLCSEKYIVSSLVCNSNEKELSWWSRVKSKCMEYVPGCLILNHVTSSAGSSNR